MQFLSFLESGQLTIVLEGEIDHSKAKSYIESIQAKLELYSPSGCILDFTDVTFMDSSGIAVVINALRAVKKMGGTLSIVGLREQPFKILQISGVDKLVQIKEKVL